MGNWYQLFSYWGYGLGLLWAAGLPVPSPKLILFLNFLFIIFAGIVRLLMRKRMDPGVAAFILVTHGLAAWFVRKAPIDIQGSLIVFLLYNLSLIPQGTSLIGQWRELWVEPPKSLGDYLKSRGLL
jgi:hypothetical protein